MIETKEFKWTERKIQGKLISQFWSSSLLLMPNYTPWGWFECDLFRVTKSWYHYEYEIKLTVADFKADAKKARRKWKLRRGRWDKHIDGVKHEMLAGKIGPKRFYYVVPEGLEKKIEIPDFAGLMIAHPRVTHATEIKRAPDLNKCKVELIVVNKARERAYYRYLHLIGRDERGDND